MTSSLTQAMLQMTDAVISFPDHLVEARELCRNFKYPIVSASRVVILGMGGSAIGGDLLKVLAEQISTLPVSVIRNEQIPNYVDENTLVLVVSYSGNTQETLAALKAALYKSNGKVIAISTGGSLKEDALTKLFPCLEIPGGLMPRAALGFTFLPLLSILEEVLHFPDQSAALDETVQILRGIRNEMGPEQPREKNEAKQLAHKVINKLPIIYAPTPYLAPAARRWKCQFNENSKQPAYFGVFPEVTHNEIVGLTHPLSLHKSLFSIFLRDSSESKMTQTKIEFTKKAFSKVGGEVYELHARGEGFLAKIFSLCYMGDFVSLYLAEEKGVDPMSIDIIDALKKELRAVNSTACEL